MNDPNIHAAIIKLIIAYTLVGAFLVTVIITIFSHLGWIRFADSKQQRKLYKANIALLVIGCLGVFLNFFNVSPKYVQQQLEQPLQEKIVSISTEKQEIEDYLKTERSMIASLTEEKSAAVAEAGKLQLALKTAEDELAIKRTVIALLTVEKSVADAEAEKLQLALQTAEDDLVAKQTLIASLTKEKAEAVEAENQQLALSQDAESEQEIEYQQETMDVREKLGELEAKKDEALNAFQRMKNFSRR